jgi:NAD(P)-dependent dehydrogenase (short-subunit alcohol dehydrogenase family)
MSVPDQSKDKNLMSSIQTQFLNLKAHHSQYPAIEFGGIDVVDSNAGYLNQWKKIGESDPTSWWKTWEVNLSSNWDIDESTQLKDQIVQDDLLVNRLRTKA